MTSTRRIASASAAICSGLAVAILAAQTPQAPQSSQPARDTSAQRPARDTSAQPQQTAVPPPTGRITGRVLAADTGRAVRAARVTLSANQAQGGRTASTDENGTFTFTALPEGRYTVSAAKTGFVNASFGQRRAMQPGIPLQLTAGATLQNIDVKLPRGSAIEGHVYDENGDPAPATMVSVSRYQYVNGERRLQPAGSAQTDDRGTYRVWGLNPGDYYVSAMVPNLGGIVGDVLGGIGGRGRGGPGGAGGPGGPGGGGGGRGRGAAAAAQGAPGAGDSGGGGAVAAGGGGRAGRGAARGGIGAVSFGGADITELMATATQVLGNVDLSALGNIGNLANLFSAQDPNSQIAYAPTYYPGVIAPGEARAITVPLSGEALGIDFSLLLVRLSRITGHAVKPDGTAATAGNVTLVGEGQGGRGGPFMNYGGRIGNDGTFTIANVPPGRYTLRARSGGGPGGGNDPGRGGRGGAAGRGRGGDPAVVPTLLFASQPLSVGGDVADMAMNLAPGAKVSGTVILQLSQARPPAQNGQQGGGGAQNGGAQNARVPDVSQIRVSTQPVDSSLGNAENARVEADGTFVLNNVPPGQHWLRAQAPRGLTLKAITVNGRDVTDDPTEISSGETITGVSLVFTDKVTEVTGTITDSRNAPVTDFTVLAFPDEPALWRPQARQIMTTRPDQTGKYVLRGLPPGRYFLVTIDPTTPGEWFDPAYLEARKDGAARFSLSEGETKTQDFRLPAQ